MMVYAYWTRGDEFEQMAMDSAETAKTVDPEALIDIQVDRGDRPRMVANLDAQITVLNAYPFGTHILFLDADTIVRKPFPFGDEDLYVTWRDHVGVRDGQKVQGIAALMPINYGVLGVVNSPAVVEAFYWLRTRILKMSQKHQDWYGNQLAIADLVASRPDGDVAERRIAWTLADEGTPIRVRWLPCDTWNYTPEGEGEDVSDKAIVHCKGDRKDLLRHYAAA